MRALIDANVMLRAAQLGHPLHDACRNALETLVSAGVEVCLVPQVLYEFWVVATRPADVNGLAMSFDLARKSIDRMVQSHSLYRDDAEVFDHWHTLMKTFEVTGKPAHDARYVAAMTAHGIQTLVTLNPQDFARYSHITIMSPADILAGNLPT